jgi:hypothetical protein
LAIPLTAKSIVATCFQRIIASGRHLLSITDRAPIEKL